MTAPTEAQKAKARELLELRGESRWMHMMAQALADAVTAERAACLLLATKLDNDHDIREAIRARDKL